ncbi:AMP-binding protein [Pseudogracilibacillus auburnensis]|uniref:Fatty-acyl-CoA synthase n=1 Tax=Pseudogracilibacillus auburnensis TaxID=1494959 RepID=A0A2V3VVX7_9BACI|nr:AMP-binding protein [Pseudogracilibacillus auburnensis]MBO1004591.1 AMP-binding protein [Pseudogracilibacillus auburnensis]PXW85144.1 fatty-acyl-CoA synthase [Pseudogracilibacillus auburnensis]
MSLINKTIGSLLEKQVHLHPNHEAIIYPDLHIRKTYKEFNELVNQAAKGFLAIGVQKGDHVAIWSDNKLEWLISQFATGKIGAVLVTVNTNYQAFELEYLLKQSDSTTLIMAESYKGTSYVEIINKICPTLQQSKKGQLQAKNLPFLKNIIMISNEKREYAYNFGEVMNLSNRTAETEFKAINKTLDAHEVINMQYTSGTTGFPKGVMLSHYNIVNNADQIGNQMNLTYEDRLCIPVPFFHTFGCVLGILTAVAKGATMVIVEQFHAEKVLKAVSAEKCTALHGVPTMFIAELNHPNFDQYDLSHLRTGIMAGSTCPIEVMRDVMTKMGASEITIAYGLTESSPVITQTKVDDPIELKVSSVGRAHPNVEVKIIDPHTGSELPPNEQGELLTRGYHVMKGYYKNDEATIEVINEDGWLHSGDLATVDENGYYTITGRIKDVIIRGGENIYPREIEEFLYRHPDLLDVQVIGIPDEKYGEEIMACIILKEDKMLTKSNIRDYCHNNISWHKVPKYIEFVDRYPMTASGKIQKFKLREYAIEQLKIKSEVGQRD